jgi:predicted dehydrogenase
MASKPFQIGFIGGGVNSAVGDSHFVASQMDSHFEVVSGCFSRNPAVNLRTAERRNISRGRLYDSWQAFLDQEKSSLDAVVVLTPTPQHSEIVAAVLEARLAVVCEKALAVSTEDAEKVRRSVLKTSGRLYVTYNYSGYPMLRELRGLISTGKLGRIQQVHIEMPQEGFARLDAEGRPFVPQEWRLKDGTLPTISLDLGVHLHHIVDFLISEKPLEVVAIESKLGNFPGVIDNVVAIAHYSGDVVSTFWFSKVALGHPNGLVVRVFGDSGSAEWHQMNPEYLIFHDAFGRTSRLDRSSIDAQDSQLQRYNRFKPGHPAGFLEAFANVYSDIAADLSCKVSGDAAKPYSVDQALAGLGLLEAITRSSAEKRWVSVG